MFIYFLTLHVGFYTIPQYHHFFQRNTYKNKHKFMQVIEEMENYA